MPGETKVTTDHHEIRRWAEDRGGRPVRVKHDVLNPSASTVQIDFLFDQYDDNLEEVSWEQFFEAFESHGLALVYQTETENGKVSRFGRIVPRNAVEQAVIE